MSYYDEYVQVMNLATKNDGVIGWRFQQNLPGVEKMIGKGACWALSLFWLKAVRAGREPKYFLGVYNSNKNGKTVVHDVNVDALMAMGQHNRMLNNNPNEFDNYLTYEGMVVLMRSGIIDLNPVELFAHADSLVPRGIDCNKLVYVRGQKGGHALVFTLRNERVRFFDPNFGEYIFHSRKDFMNFFTYFLPVLYGDFGFDTFEYRDIAG